MKIKEKFQSSNSNSTNNLIKQTEEMRKAERELHLKLDEEYDETDKKIVIKSFVILNHIFILFNILLNLKLIDIDFSEGLFLLQNIFDYRFPDVNFYFTYICLDLFIFVFYYDTIFTLIKIDYEKEYKRRTTTYVLFIYLLFSFFIKIFYLFLNLFKNNKVYGYFNLFLLITIITISIYLCFEKLVLE